MSIFERLSEWRRWLVASAETEAFQLNALRWGLLAVGVGCLAAIMVGAWLPVSTTGLMEAKRLGIISTTTLRDYPKDHESAVYLGSLATAIPLAFFVWCGCAWRAWRRQDATGMAGQERMIRHEDEGLASASKLRSIPLFDYVILPLLIALAIYDGRFFTEGTNSFVLLAEDGQFVAWVQKILSGQVLHRDAFCLYGPLMVYPVAWVMQVFGQTFMVMRVYRFVLDILAYLFVYVLLRDLTQTRRVTLAGMALFMGFYFPVFPSVNGTMLRITIGMAPIYAWYRWSLTGRSRWLWLSGVAAGLIVFYSQEVGISAVLAVGAVLALQGIQGPRQSAVRALTRFLAGVMVGMLPVVLAFAKVGAVEPLFANLISYPRYAMLGYAAFPYPSLLNTCQTLIADPSVGTLRSFVAVLFIAYWPIVLYASILLFVLIRALIARCTLYDLALFGLACFGLLFYRSALARSGMDKNGTVFPPGMVLSMVLMYELYQARRQALQHHRQRWGLVSLYTGIGGCLIAGLTAYGLWTANFSLHAALDRTIHKVIDGPAAYRRAGWQPFHLKQFKGLYGPPDWVARLEQVISYVQTHTKPNDYIFVFPNEPVYYFLTERLNPTRFGNTYIAVIHAHRVEIVEMLEQKRPMYVIYSLDTWRMDNIPEDIQVPELTTYLRQHYQTETEISGTRILRRTASGLHAAQK